MKQCRLLVWMMLFYFSARSQNNLKVVVRNESNLPLSGASVVFPDLHKGASTDSLGIVLISNLPNGSFFMEISFVGYTTAKRKIVFPGNESIHIELEENSDEDNPDVVVTATRTDRSISNTPTRVEVIAGNEIGENVSMRPGEIRMLLNETTGIITQPTSAVSNTANLRIQELDGRYTQILRDGFPLYSGLSEGLSLVQITPLDLRQVEIIKGSSSTLYGGGAIAGLVNLVSKIPEEKKELNFLVNGTSTGGVDLSGYFSQRNAHAGVSFFASQNNGSAYDPSGVGFTALPKFSRFTLTPRFFLYGKHTHVNIGLGYITEKRLGGNINYIKKQVPGYFERNLSNRLTTQASIRQDWPGHGLLVIKNSYSHFNRTISIPSYQFKGLQQSSFSEISWNGGTAGSQWVTGFNLMTDHFNEFISMPGPARNYHNNTAGVFVQNTWSPAATFSLESGLRGDYTNPFGFLLLPRLSFLFKLSEHLSSRVGGGLGYKVPTIFTEESEERQYRNVLPLDQENIRYERSIGGNMDVTYQAYIDGIKLTINPLLFYTRIKQPLVLQPSLNGQLEYVNAPGFTDSKGIDLSFRLSVNVIKFFTGYSYTIVQNHFQGITSWYPLAPHHRLHFDLVYELEKKLRIAFESYYTGKQKLSDPTFGQPYWLLGALIEKTWKNFSVFINGEDLNNTRQTKWESIFTGTMDQPVFKDIYTPLEGITLNAGVKVKL